MFPGCRPCQLVHWSFLGGSGALRNCFLVIITATANLTSVEPSELFGDLVAGEIHSII